MTIQPLSTSKSAGGFEGESADPHPDLHLKRPCLLVSDLEKSLTLYRDVLGFRLDFVGAADDDSYLYTVFQISPQARLTFAALSTAHEPRGLALTEVVGVELPPPQCPYRIGIVIQVPNLATTIQTIQSLGLEVMLSRSFTAPPDKTFTEQGFYDFDGHLIVLYDKT